jgi:hypothetical protein
VGVVRARLDHGQGGLGVIVVLTLGLLGAFLMGVH